MKKIIKFLINFLSFADATIITFFVFIFNWDIVGIFEGCLSNQIQKKLQEADLRITINVAIFILLGRLFTSFLKSPIKVNLSLNNCDGSNVTELRVNKKGIGNPKTLILAYSIDYRNELLKSIVRWLGGIHIYINLPKGVTMQGDFSINSTYRDTVKDKISSEYVLFDIDEVLSHKQIKAVGQLKLKTLSSISDSISSDIELEMKNVQLKGIERFKIFILKLLVECDGCIHKIQLGEI